MYILLNRDNVLVDILNEVRYIKLQSANGIVVACAENEGTGVIGSDCDTHYTLIRADVQHNESAVKVMQIDELPEDCKPNYWIYDSETQSLQPRYTTGAEKREIAYETEAIINWQDNMITVDDANRLWYAYTAEGKVAIAQELTALIAGAKQEIRERYPDEPVVDAGDSEETTQEDYSPDDEN